MGLEELGRTFHRSELNLPLRQRGLGGGGRPVLGKAASWAPSHLSLFSDALHYAGEGRGSKMFGARGFKRQGDIGEFDLAAARNFYHHRGRFYGSGRGASIERKRGRTGYSKSIRNRRDVSINKSDVVGMGAPGVGIEILVVFRDNPTIR